MESDYHMIINPYGINFGLKGIESIKLLSNNSYFNNQNSKNDDP